MRRGSIICFAHLFTGLHTAGGTPRPVWARPQEPFCLQESGLWEGFSHKTGQQEAVLHSSINLRFKYTHKNHGDCTSSRCVRGSYRTLKIILVIDTSKQVVTSRATFSGYAGPLSMLTMKTLARRQIAHINVPCRHGQGGHLVSYLLHKSMRSKRFTLDHTASRSVTAWPETPSTGPR